MKWWATTALSVAVVGAFITWRALSQSVTHKPDVAATSDLRERGGYLVRAGDCVGCHTAAGHYQFSGGREFDLGRLGKLYSPNITPDKETGIGNWSDDDFRAAMQLGVGKDGKHLYPAFPYASYTLLSDDDVLAIKAYLFTLAPVRSVPPQNELRFPFNQRFLMAFWSLFFNPNQRFVTDAVHTAGWNRGKYLVEGLGHCGECHTPRNLLQARARGSAYAGAVTDHWLAFNISSDPDSGIGGWSDAALRSYLTEGFAPEHGPASGPMAEVVSNSLRHLTDEDIGAIIEYLRTIKPVRAPLTAGAPVASPAAASLAHGKQVYEGVCANCHHIDGAGNQTHYEALNGSHSLRDPHANNLIQAVLYGSSMETPLGQVSMPGFAGGYTDSDLAAVINYATAELGGGRTGAVDAASVQRSRQAP